LRQSFQLLGLPTWLLALTTVPTSRPGRSACQS
jgi:hypothetical protein